MAPYHIQRYCPPYCDSNLQTCWSQDKCEAPAKNLEDKFRSYVQCAIYKSIFFSHISDYNKQAKGFNTV